VDDAQEARKLARRYLRRRWYWSALVGGLGLAIGVASVSVYDRVDSDVHHLARTGAHATATIDQAVNQSGRFAFDPHLDVTYVASGRREEGVRVWIGTDTDYHAGQTLAIVYDRADPRRAVLAKPAPAQFFVFMVIGGVIAALVAVAVVGMRAWMLRPARRVLSQSPVRRAVRTTLVQASPVWKQRSIYLDNGDNISSMTTRLAWHLPDDGTHELDVFGTRRDGGVFVVDVPSRSVAFGYTAFFG
jgi:hypothetical protein